MTMPQTWHHGLVAEWWAGMDLDAPELEAYAPHVDRGRPLLDAGCGAGRLLVPWLQAGLDVDGCDASADMVERCRDRARAEGADGTLVLDNEVPYSNAGRWSWWAERPGLPRPWPVEPERGTAPD
jgi:SAM-dependent methyltransferase